MSRTKLSLVGVVLAGILVFLSQNAPTLAVVGDATAATQTPSSTAPGSPLDLNLLILVDRLELSPAQMRTVRDLLAGVLDLEASLEADRASFEQDLIRFHGTEKELDDLVAVFEARTAKALVTLRERSSQALDQLKDVLTVRQGQTLREGLRPLIGSAGGRFGTALGARGARLGALGQARGLGQAAPSQGAGRAAADQSPLQERLQGFLKNHPALRDELLGALRGTSPSESQTPSDQGAATEGTRLLRGRSGASSELLGGAFARLAELVRVLDLKLQYVN